MFSYRVETNMAGGQVEFRLPSGWTIHQTATDTDILDDDAYSRYSTANADFLVEVQEKFGGTGDAEMVIYRLNRDGKIA